MYRCLVISSSLAEEMEGTASNFDKVLTDDFVRNHLQPAVALAISTKKRLGQWQSWRLPACINYKEIRLSVECAVDGAWGSLSGSACLVYLVQRYSLMGTPRVSIYLYSSSTSMNSLTKLSHQIDSELGAIALGTKETQKAIQSLKEMNVKIDRTILVSDSQTCLSLFSRPSSTLDLSTSLIVSRVQDLWFPNLDNLFFAPGETFHTSVDLLTRYNTNLASLITSEFYSPSWMKSEISNRVTVKVTNMRKQPEETLPHLCAQQKVWALMEGSNLGANRLTKQPASTQTLKGSLHSTGSWGMQRKEKCLPPGEGGATCLMCKTAPLGQASSQDMIRLEAAKEKQLKKTLLKTKPDKPAKILEKFGA